MTKSELGGIRDSTRSFHNDWLVRSLERLDERRQRGDHVVEMQIGELQHLISELIGMHQRCDRLEDMLNHYALYAIPLKETIKP
jgi:hypothetical protein